jgi:hypothetical protein
MKNNFFEVIQGKESNRFSHDSVNQPIFLSEHKPTLTG